MNARIIKIFKDLDRFIKNHCPTNQSKYIHLRKRDYKLPVESLSYREQCLAEKKWLCYLSRFHHNIGEIRCAVLIPTVIIRKHKLPIHALNLEDVYILDDIVVIL